MIPVPAAAAKNIKNAAAENRMKRVKQNGLFRWGGPVLLHFFALEGFSAKWCWCILGVQENAETGGRMPGENFTQKNEGEER